MAKYSEKLAAKFVHLLEEDKYTILEICDMLGINRKTFYEWKKAKPEFARQIDDVCERRDEKLVVKARKSLSRKLDGYCLTESRSTYIRDAEDPDVLQLKSHVVKKKEYAPDTSSIRLTMARGGGEGWREAAPVEDKPRLYITFADAETKTSLTRLCESGVKGNR